MLPIKRLVLSDSDSRWEKQHETEFYSLSFRMFGTDKYENLVANCDKPVDYIKKPPFVLSEHKIPSITSEKYLGLDIID